ncbi:coiled-coil domain-containing protein [Legionella clemsonensis]|uniref:Uncharacterized protein n=1 Tax=Legionella clemsonensis TaxID=1867846 RepID=A0A222P0A8_9GAMM|nr:hypothetical protein [Legionella clemsonensis]ASQ45272.1 hypothetical protein clem_03570 [Legionella clemsonensis]
MSGSIFAEMTKLKAKLKEINNGQEINPNPKNFSGLSLSEKTFVHPSLLPPALTEEVSGESVATPEEMEDYSKRAMEAVWYIASFDEDSIKNYASIFFNRDNIWAAFNFLDNDNVPKIVDERTYQVGKALLEFLNKVTSDEIINNLREEISIPPFGPQIIIRQQALAFMNPKKEALRKKLAIYEAHTPNKIAEKEALLAIRETRLKRYNEITSTFGSVLEEVTYLSSQIGASLEEAGIEPEKLKKLQKEIQQQLEKLTKAYEKFDEDIEQWDNENHGEFDINGVSGRLPQSIELSNFLYFKYNYNSKEAAVSAERVLDEWKRLFNSSSSLFHYEILGKLENSYERKENLLILKEGKIASLKILQEEVAQQLQIAEDIAPLVKELSERVNEALYGKAPDVSQPKNSQDCAKEIVQLQTYLATFQQKTALTYDSFATYPFPEEKNDPLYEKAYKKAIEEAKGQLLEGKEEKIKEIKDMIAVLQKQQREFEHEEAKQSAEKRNELLSELIQRVDSLREQKYSIQVQETDAHRDAEEFFTRQYQPAVETIHKKTQALLVGLTADDNERQSMVREDYPLMLKQEEAKRREFLQIAQEALQSYEKLLQESTGIYIPTDKIPREELKKYLEVTKATRIEGIIDEIYDEQEKAKASVVTNITNYWNHYTSWMGPSNFDMDFNLLQDAIADKLKQISAELSVEVTAEPGEPSQSSNLAGNNLYTLQRKSNESTRLVNINQLKVEEAEWDKKKKNVEQKAAEATLHRQLAIAQYNQAVLEAAIFRLDSRLFEIKEKANTTLADITLAMTQKTGDEALEYFTEIKGSLDELDVESLLTVSSIEEGNGRALKLSIKEQLKDLEKLWGTEINELSGQIESLPKAIQTLKEEAAAHFVTLQQQTVKLEPTEQRLTEAVKTKKGIIFSLKEMAIQQSEIAKLLDRSKEMQLANNEAKIGLIADISNSEASRQKLLEELGLQENAAIKEKLAVTKEMIKELDKAKVDLQLDLLNKITAKFAEFTTKNFTAMNLPEEHFFEQELENFKKEIKNALDVCNNSDNAQVKEKFSAVEKIKEAIPVVIPTFEKIEEFSEKYAELIKKAENIPPKRLRPGLELIKAADKLEAESMPALEKAKALSLSPEKVAAILKAQQTLRDLKEEYTKRYTENPSLLIQEVYDEYHALNVLRKESEKSEFQFYEKSKKGLYDQIIALKNSELLAVFNSRNHGESEQLNSIYNYQAELKAFTFQQAPQSHAAALFFNKPTVRLIEDQQEAAEKFSNARAYLETKYFGDNTSESKLGGAFGTYLQQRAEQFWFRDLMSSFLAFGLSCFGWKTEVKLREDYLLKLKDAFQKYKEDPENYHDLLKIVGEGQQFKPRSESGEKGYEKTLQSYLADFKREVRIIHDQNVEDKPVESSQLGQVKL